MLQSGQAPRLNELFCYKHFVVVTNLIDPRHIQLRNHVVSRQKHSVTRSLNSFLTVSNLPYNIYEIASLL